MCEKVCSSCGKRDVKFWLAPKATLAEPELLCFRCNEGKDDPSRRILVLSGKAVLMNKSKGPLRMVWDGLPYFDQDRTGPRRK